MRGVIAPQAPAALSSPHLQLQDLIDADCPNLFEAEATGLFQVVIFHDCSIGLTKWSHRAAMIRDGLACMSCIAANFVYSAVVSTISSDLKRL